MTIFSQFGEPVHVNLVRNKETGKSRGFAFLKYEDQRSTDLAVDNLGGASVLGRVLKVDHARYKKRDDEEEDDDNVTWMFGEKEEDKDGGGGGGRSRRRRGSEEATEERARRPLLKEEMELAELVHNHDDEDPMKDFLIEEKKEEVTLALERVKREGKRSSSHRSSRHHRHHRHHRRHRRSPSGESQQRGSYRNESWSRERSPSRSPRRRRERHDRGR